MTVYIYKNTANAVCFTLNESRKESNTFLFLEVYSKATNTSKYIWLNTDLSTRPERYNRFIITEVETGTEDPAEQTINLTVGGYTYFVWETETYTTDKTTALGCIESGILHVEDVNTPVSATNITNTKNVFI